ncbi:hypothetical protein BC938DRAFT_483906 [Jimgerdemannia flammicorona]|uniref:Mid2 domain-containing protein n=1 Tax=Jimgerdemannia flammicorona TaxID=994334 RepID=A0A433QVG2_9FUNG|nr:hypothetical protein BC938DRAFT_483906 [Jimgerdemannia flammicorona]
MSNVQLTNLLTVFLALSRMSTNTLSWHAATRANMTTSPPTISRRLLYPPTLSTSARITSPPVLRRGPARKRGSPMSTYVFIATVFHLLPGQIAPVQTPSSITSITSITSTTPTTSIDYTLSAQNPGNSPQATSILIVYITPTATKGVPNGDTNNNNNNQNVYITTNNNTGMIIGIVVGVVAAVAIVICVVYYIQRPSPSPSPSPPPYTPSRSKQLV